MSFVLVFQNTISTSKSIRQFRKYTLISFFLILSLFNITQIILPSGLLSKNQFEEKISNLKEDESFDCWWTVWAKKEAFQQKEKVIAQNRDIRISTWEGEKREFEIGGGQMTNARIATFYYPHWKATINDENVEVSRNEDGTISIALPTESAKVRLSFIEPFRIRVAEAISAICWVLLIFAGLIYFFRNNRNGLKFKLIN
ncbi:MAG: hypothetical protein HC846_13840 [Blastocatellia bacterium]|nr:hypothetical protein [Blastocatellia bacterium]